jgi:hypothetical protein
MDLGWKVLIPGGLLWILITGAAIALPAKMGTARAAMMIVGLVVLLVLVLGPLFTGPPRGVEEPGDPEEPTDREEPADHGAHA